MKKSLLIITLLMLSCSVFGQNPVESTLRDNIKPYVSFVPIPEKGKFFTVQIATIRRWKSNLREDEQMLVSFMFIDPVYFYVEDEHLKLYLGQFKDRKEAKNYIAQLSCFYGANKPFVSAFSEGTKVGTYGIQTGNVKTKYPNIAKAKKKLTKFLKKDYHRIQVGYYEKEGYEPDEEKKFEILKKNGYAVVEEAYKNGRLVLVDKKYHSLNEALDEQSKIEQLIGGYCALKKYYNFTKLEEYFVFYLHEYLDCISE